VSHASPLVVIVPGEAQYSVAHAVAHPPVVPQMQLAMSWKYAVSLPHPFWQHVMQVLEASASQVWVQVVPPDELPLLDPLELPLLEPLDPPLPEPLELPLPPPLELPGQTSPGRT
jgi:hypothetical protein